MPQPPDLPPGTLQFYDNATPLLDAGDYTLTFRQMVTDDTGATLKELDFSQTLTVAGVQYAIDPNVIASMYPPDNGQGAFDDVLAHIVLTDRTLPWVRMIDAKTSADVFQVPWLTLFVFSSDELSAVNDSSDPNMSRTFARTTTVEQVVSSTPPPGVRLPKIQVPDSDRTLPCQSVDIDANLFKAIAPLRAELPFLCHARQINTDNQEILGTNEQGWYSMVVANRLPAPDGINIVHLVSLEGMADYLPDFPDTGGYTTVRLFSLASWSFTSFEGGNFESLMTRVAQDISTLRLPMSDPDATGLVLRFEIVPSTIASGDSATLNWQTPSATSCALQIQTEGQTGSAVQTLDPSSTSSLVNPTATTVYTLTATDASGFTCQRQVTLIVNPSDEDKWASDAFANGYIPLRHLTRVAEQTVAWYRSPLSPMFTPRNFSSKPYHTADETMIYDQATGLFDQSFAVAWQIGRLLCISNGSFSVALMNWRRQGYQLINLLNERLNFFTDYDQIIDTPDTIEALLARHLPKQGAKDWFTRVLSGNGETPPVIPQSDPTNIRQRLHEFPGLVDLGEAARRVGADVEPHLAIFRYLFGDRQGNKL